MNELYEVNKKYWTRASVLSVNLQMEWWSSDGLFAIIRALYGNSIFSEIALPATEGWGMYNNVCRM